MENKEHVFLAKIQQVLKLLNEIDEQISKNPDNQSNTDQLLSDYYHLIQDNKANLTDSAKLKLIDDVEKARLEREWYRNIHELGKYFTSNKTKLPYPNSRDAFYKGLSELFKSLHLPYNYRVLKEEEIKSIINQDDVKQEKTSRKPMLTKDQLEEFLKSGMKSKEIANKLNCTQSYISVLKKKYGFETRKYRKGDK